MTNNILLDTALQYREFSYSVIPVGKDKKPLIQWQRYQKEQASEEQIKRWWKQWPDANIAIITGDSSGIAVIDIDTEEGKLAIQEYIPDSLVMPVANTPSGGQHLYFKCPDEKLSNNTRAVIGCDLRANGGYVVAPPSINGTGKAYAWQEGLSFNQIALPELPEAYLSFIKKNAVYNNNSFSFIERDDTPGANNCRQESSLSPEVVKYFSHGSRDETLFHIANALIKGNCNQQIAYKTLEIIAKNCTPPFAEKDIPVKLQSALKRSASRITNLSQEIREYILSSSGVIMSSEVV